MAYFNLQDQELKLGSNLLKVRQLMLYVFKEAVGNASARILGFVFYAIKTACIIHCTL
jgi:hypothetical protein